MGRKLITARLAHQQREEEQQPGVALVGGLQGHPEDRHRTADQPYRDAAHCSEHHRAVDDRQGVERFAAAQGHRVAERLGPTFKRSSARK